MTRPLKRENIVFIMVFTSIQVLLTFLALLVAWKPEVILSHRLIFCSVLFLYALMLLGKNNNVEFIIRHYYLKEEPCIDHECIMTHKKNHGKIFISLIQGTIPVAFGVLGMIICFSVFFNKLVAEQVNFYGTSYCGLVVSTSIFFSKISDDMTMFFSRIYCGIIAFSILASILISAIVNFIGYRYCKHKLNSKDEKFVEDFKESVRDGRNTVINILNFFHYISNFLLSVHCYSCHLFVTKDHLKANCIAYDHGIRTKYSCEKLSEEENKKNIDDGIYKVGCNIECNCQDAKDRNDKYHIWTNENVYHCENIEDSKSYVYKIEKNERREKGGSLVFNVIGVNFCYLRLDDYGVIRV